MIQCINHSCVSVTFVCAITKNSYESYVSPKTKGLYISKGGPLAHNSSEMCSVAKSPHEKSPEL